MIISGIKHTRVNTLENYNYQHFCEETGDDGMVVKIKDLIDEMDMQMDEYNKYLNKETGEIITVSTEDLSIVEESEEDDDFSQYPDW